MVPKLDLNARAINRKCHALPIAPPFLMNTHILRDRHTVRKQMAFMHSTRSTHTHIMYTYKVKFHDLFLFYLVALKRACCLVVVALKRAVLGRISGGDRSSLLRTHFSSTFSWTGGGNAHHHGVTDMGCVVQTPMFPVEDIPP